MLVNLRREYAHLVTSGAQLLILLIGFKVGTRTGWIASLSLMAIISFIAWISALNRLRAIRDTPTSRISSAAQGYVELIGRGHHFGDPLISKFNALPCLWYRYKVEQRSQGDEWRVVDKGESYDSFVLRDETGECVVDPEDAEIITLHHDQWQKDGFRYNEWKLIEFDRIYVIGDFHTKGGSNYEFNSREELNALLADWKKDMPSLLKRFDLDNNGTLDMQEWMLARSAAKREVSKLLSEAQAQNDINIISRPRSGRLFMISNISQEKLSRRYLFWSWAHLMIFFGAIVGTGWVLQSSML